MWALRTAAQRGARVRRIVPAKVGSLLVRHAGHACYVELLDAGVEILLFDAGLLHTKSMVADRELAFVGTLNLDLRNFLLTFEVTLIAYDPVFAEGVATLANGYTGRTPDFLCEAIRRGQLSCPFSLGRRGRCSQTLVRPV